MDKDTDINFISVLLVTFNSLMHTIYLIELKKKRELEHLTQIKILQSKIISKITFLS